MSYTNIELVKKHISLSSEPIGRRNDYAVIFGSTEWVSLPGHAIVPGSVSVKVLAGFAPVMENAIFISDEITLAHKPLVNNSAAVAADSSLGIIYSENIDYSIDASGGIMRRLSEGNIAVGSTVIVWYYYYSLFEEGSDYAVNYAEGLIRRLANGQIQSGQTVLVDYELSSYQLGDDVIAAVVSEANAIIEKEIDLKQVFGADPALQTAATYLAMSILCRILGANESQSGAKSGSGSKSEGWLLLSESYRFDYERQIKPFRPQMARMSGPTLS